MKRGTLIVVAVAALFAAGEAAACSVFDYWTEEQLQEERQYERTQWDRSQWVSLAKVEKRSVYFGRIFRTNYRTIVPLKGDSHPEVFTKTIWMSLFDHECGFGYPPGANTHVILYSSPKSGLQKYLPWLRPTYTWYQYPEYVTDRRVAVSLRSAANRLKSSNK